VAAPVVDTAAALALTGATVYLAKVTSGSDAVLPPVVLLIPISAVVLGVSSVHGYVATAECRSRDRQQKAREQSQESVEPQGVAWPSPHGDPKIRAPR
jgi:hypothetical protein